MSHTLKKLGRYFDSWEGNPLHFFLRNPLHSILEENLDPLTLCIFLVLELFGDNSCGFVFMLTKKCMPLYGLIPSIVCFWRIPIEI